MRKINKGPIYRERNPYDVVDEMQYLYDNHGVKSFYFNDDLYFSKKNETRLRPKIIAEEIIKRGMKITYKVELRADSIDVDNDMHFFTKLKLSGMDRVFIGVESGSKKMLDCLGKNIPLQDCMRSIDFVKSVGIVVNAGRILFGPHTDWDELEDSISFFGALGACAQLMRRSNSILEAFPGTKLTETLDREGILHDGVSYKRRGYEFKVEKVGEFHNALSSYFDVYFGAMKEYFSGRAAGKIHIDTEEEMQRTCFNFLDQNVKLGSEWTIDQFHKLLLDFVCNLREICENRAGDNELLCEI